MLGRKVSLIGVIWIVVGMIVPAHRLRSCSSKCLGAIVTERWFGIRPETENYDVTTAIRLCTSLRNAGGSAVAVAMSSPDAIRSAMTCA